MTTDADMGPPPYELIVKMVERDPVRLEVDDGGVALRHGPVVRLARTVTTIRRATRLHRVPARHRPATPPPPQGNPPFAHGS
jgi:hypothetical protein